MSPKIGNLMVLGGKVRPVRVLEDPVTGNLFDLFS